jgi:hypothetical protein
MSPHSASFAKESFRLKGLALKKIIALKNK